MANYRKPVAVATTGAAEGVFAASGNATCWTVTPRSVQDWNGAAHVFEMALVHTKAVSHFSEACTVDYTFSVPVTNAWAEGAGNYDVTWSGNTVTVTRHHHANGEYSGDNVTYKVFVVAGDEATTKGASCTSATVLECEKTGTPNYPDID